MAEVKEKMNHEVGNMMHESELRQEYKKQPEGLQDVRQRHEVPKEIKTWMQKIEEGTHQQTVVNDDAGYPLLTPAAPANPKVQLPATRKSFVEGFKKPFDEAGRWLSAFILRLIKKSEGNVKFRQE